MSNLPSKLSALWVYWGRRALGREDLTVNDLVGWVYAKRPDLTREQVAALTPEELVGLIRRELGEIGRASCRERV